MDPIQNLMTEYTQKIRAATIAEMQQNLVTYAGGLANFGAGTPGNNIIRRKPGRPAGSKNGSGTKSLPPGTYLTEAKPAKINASGHIQVNFKKPVAQPAPAPQTAKLTAARKLQGSYLGSLKRLAGKKREQVKAEAAKNGVASAVKLAAKLLGGK